MESTAFPMFRRSLHLLNENWSMILPGLLIGIVSGALDALFEAGPNATLAAAFISLFLNVITGVIATILAITYTTGMAQAAWTRGRATFGDGTLAFRREGRHVFVALLCLLGLGVAASFLTPFTVGISLAVYAFFCIYAIPAAVVGERKGVEALAESAEIAAHRPLQTGLMIAAIALIAIAMGLIAQLLSVAPLVGPLVSQVVVEAVVAYVTLVVVGEYMTLRGMPTA